MAEVGNHPASPGSSRNLNLNCRGVSIPSFPDNGTPNFIAAYLSGTAGQNYRAFIISAADGTTVLAQSDIRTDISSAGYYQFSGGTLGSFSLVATTAYYLCIGSEENSVALLFFASGTETFDGIASASGISDVDPLTFNSGGMGADSTRDYAVYIDYTIGGGGGGGVCPKPGIRQSSNPSVHNAIVSQ